MQVEQLKAVSRRAYEELWNQHRPEVADEIIGLGYLYHDPTGDAAGVDGFKEHVAGYLRAFPDLHFIVEDLIAEGDRVAVRWTARGTHQGEVMGIAPTGKEVAVAGMSIDRISGGKIVESWSNWDALGLLQQLRTLPAGE